VQTANEVNGLIYIAGGCDGAQNCNGYCACSSFTSDMTIYFPANDSYVSVSPMPRPRYRHIACAVDTSIYYFGGRQRDTDEIITEVDVFNTLNRSWTTLSARYPSDLGTDNSCSTVGTSVYVMGGYSSFYDAVSPQTYAFTPSNAANPWTKKTATMAFPRGDFASVELGGKIYAYGGYQLDFCNPIRSLEVYDPVADKWANSTALPSGLAAKDDGVVIGSLFIVIGGERKSKTVGCVDTDITPLKAVYSFNAATRTWANETTLPDARMRFAAAGANGVAYVFGGQGPLINGNKNPILYTSYAYVSPSSPAAEKTVPYDIFAGAIAGTAVATFVLFIFCVAAVCFFSRRVVYKSSSNMPTGGAILLSGEGSTPVKVES
jgi:hypothetical protein